MNHQQAVQYEQWKRDRIEMISKVISKWDCVKFSPFFGPDTNHFRVDVGVSGYLLISRAGNVLELPVEVYELYNESQFDKWFESIVMNRAIHIESNSFVSFLQDMVQAHTIGLVSEFFDRASNVDLEDSSKAKELFSKILKSSHPFFEGKNESTTTTDA